MRLAAVVVASALFAVAQAHMCLVSPSQRGPAVNLTVVRSLWYAHCCSALCVRVCVCACVRMCQWRVCVPFPRLAMLTLAWLLLQAGESGCAWTDGPCGKQNTPGAPTFYTNG